MKHQALIERRRRAIGPGYSTFYDEPVHIVRGEGIFMWDSDGKQYLDCYNNVASVGHCHPDVLAALTEQAGRLNTHTRYLHENIVDLAELLASKLPGDLGVCLFVCTGSEANDLALQIAEAVTGHDGHICSEAAYHGNTKLVRALSTHQYEAVDRPDWLAVIEPPDLYRGPFGDDAEAAVPAFIDDVRRAISELETRGYGVASIMIDSIYDNPGPFLAPPGYAKETSEIVRASGGLVIADEVQAGYTRTGGHWWGFEHGDILPDIVTLGKPMGDGHPLACVVTTPEIAAKFAEIHSYFNTFGGNPVAMAVGRAVIEVIDREGLKENVDRVSEQLIPALRDLAAKHDTIIGQVRGAGLFLGLDMVTDPDRRTPMAKGEVRRIISMMAEEGVLVGMVGRYDNVVKVRPPLVFDLDNADQLLTTLDQVLTRYRLSQSA